MAHPGIVEGTAGADTIDGTYSSDPEGDGVTSGNDTIDGGAGGDFIKGGDGNDVIAGGTGTDEIYGGTGNDTISGGIYDYTTGGFIDDGEDDEIFAGAGDDTVYFGSGDQVAGEAGNDTFIAYENVDGAQINGGGTDNTDWDVLDLSGITQPYKITQMSDASDKGAYMGWVVLEDGTKFQFKGIEQIICFGSGTLIATPEGEVRVDDLAVGDLVTTRDHGDQPLRWIGHRTLDRVALELVPQYRPIRIRAGALGKGLPAQDLIVSPQHRMLVRSHIAQKMFGTYEVLVAAKQLLQLDGIDIADDLTEITYVHFLFDQHEIVLANGAESESLYTGAEALKSVGPAAREEIFGIFPELRDRDPAKLPPAARILASGRKGRRLAVRHLSNGRSLVS